MHLFLSFFSLNKLVFPQRFKFYLIFYIVVVLIRCLVCRRLITTFDFLSACYDVVLFVILLQCFICVEAIQIGKADSIS